MKTAVIILLIIGLVLGSYFYYTTRYFNDLYGKNSILYSRQSVRIDQRFWPFTFIESVNNLSLFGVGIMGLYFFTWMLISNKINILVIILLFIVSLICISLPVLLFLVNRKLRELNDFEYIFDPTEKSLEVVGLIKIYKTDITEIEYLKGGKYYGLIKKIHCKNGTSIILSDFLPCYDVISEFFGGDILTTFRDYDLITYTIKLYKRTL